MEDLHDPRPSPPEDLTKEGEGDWKLFNAFAFLRIRYAERPKYNLFALGMAVVISAGYFFAPVKPALLGEQGLLQDLQEFVQILFPFFVGALAAVATFARRGLDEETVGGKAVLRYKSGDRALTRRQFVCYILGYCAVLSVFLFVGIILVKIVHPSLAPFFREHALEIKTAAVFVFALGFSHLVTITLWALYYLTNRLNR